MLSHKEKISFRQAMILVLALLFSPAIRFFPAQVAKSANQAGWLTPLVSFMFLTLLIYIFHSFYEKHPNASFMEIICVIMGKFLGCILLVVYLVWLIILLSLYIRYYAIRINVAVTPKTDIYFFILVMLTLVVFVLRNGLVVFARMGEIIFLILFMGFTLLFIFSIPNIKVDNLTPISYLDISPIIKGSYHLTALWVYFILIFFFSDKINDKEMIKTTGMKGALFLLISTPIIAVMTIGSVGYSVIERTNLPFFTAVKNISIFESVDRIEALVVTQWIISDFVIIIVFFYSILCIIKYLFNLSGTKSFISILAIFMYVLSLYIAKSQFELQEFSGLVAVHFNIIFGLIIPILLFIVGKIRKKI